MKRLTTDQPSGNVKTFLNLFYAKDGEAWVRGGGPEPLYQDVRLFDFIREAIRDTADEERTYIADFSDEELGECMLEWLTDGNTSIEGLIGTLYTAAWAFAEIRERLKFYEDAEAEGRLVMLPCKVGDTVWTNCSVKGDYLRDKDRPYPCEVVFIGLSATPFIHVVLPKGRMLPFTFEDIGKTVFLTREEAEAVLKGGTPNA